MIPRTQASTLRDAAVAGRPAESAMADVVSWRARTRLDVF